jgi:hypothetical protein
MTGMWALLLAAVFLIGDSGFQVVEVSRPRLPRLRSALLRREKEDQAARTAWIKQMQASGGKVGPSPEMKRMEQVDAINRIWLKGVMARYGWPGHSLVGKDGAHAA